MTFELSLIALVALLVLGLIVLASRRASTLNRDYFKSQWRSIEIMSKTKASWVQAIVDGDKLLDEALKQLHFKGKTTADRMVSANRSFSDTDGVWTAHKIRNKVVHETGFRLKKAHVNSALSGFERALKDLGAI